MNKNKSLNDDLTRCIIGAAIEVHKLLGPGLLESIYEEALCHEFELRNIMYERQVEIITNYKGVKIKGQRIDLIVENNVVLELKSIYRIPDVVLSQVLSYLHATNLKIALLINFGEKRLVDGIKRIVL